MPEKTPPLPTDLPGADDDRVYILPVVMVVITPEEYAAMLAEDPLTDVDPDEVV